MKAFLLAAGVGSRLKPVTDVTPKCMLRFGDRPLLDIWLDSLASAGVGEVLVNLHHLAEVVCRHVKARTTPPAVRTFYEPELLGSAGTLVANRHWVEGEDCFLACNADNLTDFDLGPLIDLHRGSQELATLAVFRAEHPSACGVVELDGHGRVVGFVEKPSNPASDLANAGIYAFHPEALDRVGGPRPLDIGKDLLPRLVGRANAILVEGYFRDIGTPEAYRQGLAEWRARQHR